jgi:hypothetical protein
MIQCGKTLLFCGMSMILINTTYLLAQEKVKIAIWGDSRENHLGACENITEYLLHEETDWDFQVHTGDFTHAGYDEHWQKSLNYKGMDSLYIPGKFFMCTSNHDDVVSTWDNYTAGVLPINFTDSTTHFFHHQMGNVHVITCDAYFTNSETMNNWLEQELATIPEEDWVIGVWHNPCYGDITYKSSYLNNCSPWLEKFYAYGGDFIFHGHAHTYVRSHPLLPDGTVDHENGIVHIINGCGGASFKSPQTVVEKTAFTPSVNSFACITFVTIEGNSASVRTVDVRKLVNWGTIDEWTWGETSGVDQNSTTVANKYELNQCYPNPFNPTTTIRYSLPKTGYVKLIVYDIQGKEVVTLVNERQNAGVYNYVWEALNSDGQLLPSGMYIYHFQSGSFMQSQKMLLIR